MKKLPASLNSPVRLVLAVVLIILLGEALIMVLIEVVKPFSIGKLQGYVWGMIDPILLVAFVLPALYILIFRPMRAQQSRLELQLDELQRFQRVSIGRELRMKALHEQNRTLQERLEPDSTHPQPVQAEPAATSDTNSAVQERTALLYMLEDLAHSRELIEHSQQEWIATVDAIREPMFLHDAEFRVIRANRAYAELAGKSFKQIIGQPYWQLFPRYEHTFPGCCQALQQTEPIDEEFAGERGEIFLSRAFALHDEQGTYRFSVHILLDITEHKRQADRTSALLQLSRDAEQLDEQSLLQRGLDIVQQLTRSKIGFLHFVSADQNEIELVTWTTDTLAHYCQAVYDRHYPVDKAGIWADCIRLKQAVVVNDYASAPNKNGLPEGHASLQRFVSVPIYEGELVRMIVGVGNAAHDYDEHDVEIARLFGQNLYHIVQRKRMEHDLRESEEKFHQISASAQDAILMMDNEGKISFWNSAAERIFGYSAAEALGAELHSLIVPIRFREIFASRFPAFLGSGQGTIIGKTVELMGQRNTGEEIPVELSVSAIQLHQQWHAVGILRDISERKQAEQTLQRSNRALKTLSAGNQALIHATDEQQLLSAICNTAVETGGYRLAWVGYAREDEAKNIEPMAQAGFDEGYLAAQRVTWADDECGRGPGGNAIRSGQTQIAQDLLSDPDFLPWREYVLKHGYAACIALPLKDGDKTFGVLTIYDDEPHVFDAAEIYLLEEMANDLAFGILTLRIKEAHRLHEQRLHDSLIEIIQAVASIVEQRDPYTAGHQRRTADLAQAIAHELGLSADDCQTIYLAGVVHDVGKVSLPAEILSKPGKLSKIEFSLICTHAQSGYDILAPIHFPWPIAQIVLQHHERMDGSGYPNGLKDEQILLAARILGVADVVEAMSSHRPYRASLGIQLALEEIELKRGSHFDPRVVDACISLFHDKQFAFKD